MKLKLAGLLLLLGMASNLAYSQDTRRIVLSSSGAPTGSCAVGVLDVDTTNQAFYFCGGDGAWHSSGGGGTVTNVTASAPVTSSGGATPNIACATCATTTNGGALSGTAPIAVSAAGVISGGGLGTTTGALKGNGAGVITQAACADLSNAATSCSTDATNGSNISSGTVAGARVAAINLAASGNGGVTGQLPIGQVGSSGLSAAAPIAIAATGAITAGGLSTVTGALKGNGSGTITQAACGDLSNAAASCSTDATNASNISSGTLPNARLVAVPNSSLANSSTTVNNSTCTLGGTCTPPSAEGINAQTSNYTLVSGDQGKTVTFSGSYLIATLPASPPSSTWSASIENLGTTVVQVNRNGLTINGKAFNITLPPGKKIRINTDNSNYFADSACPSGTVCPYDWGAMFDARWTGDGSTTNASAIVTSATIAFTAQDLTLGRNVFVIRPSGTNTLVVSTISSVDSGTQIHASNTATATVASQAIAVCTDDTAAIRASFAAAIANNLKFWLPGGSTCVSSVPISITGTPSPVTQIIDIEGSGMDNYFVMMPNFNFTSPVNCTASTNGCIVNVQIAATYAYPDFIHQTSRVGSFGLTNLGWLPGTAGVAMVYCNQPGCNVHDVQATGWSGLGGTAIFRASSEQSFYNLQVQNINQSAAGGGGSSSLIAIYVPTNNVEIRTVTLNSGGGYGIEMVGARDIHISGLLDLATYPTTGTRAAVYSSSSSTRIVVDGFEVGGMTGSTTDSCFAVDGTSDLTVKNGRCSAASGATGAGLLTASGGKIYAQNYVNTITNSTPGVNNAGSLYDLGGNTFGTFSGAGSYFGTASVTGTAQTSGNIALTSGWGTSSVGTVSGNTKTEQWTVTAAGSPAASPVITVTFPVAFPVAPICQIQEVSGTFGVLTNPTISTAASTATITFSGTAVATQTYTYALNCDLP